MWGNLLSENIVVNTLLGLSTNTAWLGLGQLYVLALNTQVGPAFVYLVQWCAAVFTMAAILQRCHAINHPVLFLIRTMNYVIGMKHTNVMYLYVQRQRYIVVNGLCA